MNQVSGFRFVPARLTAACHLLERYPGQTSYLLSTLRMGKETVFCIGPHRPPNVPFAKFAVWIPDSFPVYSSPVILLVDKSLVFCHANDRMVHLELCP